MSAVVVQKSSQLVATRSMSWKGCESITRTGLVAYRTELVVMLWDVVHSRRLGKHGQLPTRYLRVAAILKETSNEFLRHLTSLPRHSYEYPRVPTTYIVGMLCRTRRALQLVATLSDL